MSGNFYKYVKKNHARKPIRPNVGRKSLKEQFFSRYRIPVKKSIATSMDEFMSLAEHDRRFHGGSYIEGQKCNLRDYLKKEDSLDVGENNLSSERGAKEETESSSTKEDIEFAEAYDAVEAARKSGDRETYRKYSEVAREMFERRARDAFKNSRAVDLEGNPTLIFHGTKDGGFTEFDCDGKGSTEGTGAWFSKSRDVSSTYSGRAGDFFYQNIDYGYLEDAVSIYHGYTIVDANGENVITDELYDEEDSLKDNYDVETDKGEKIVECWQMYDRNGYDDGLFYSKDDMVKWAQEHRGDYIADDDKGPCVYPCFLNIKDTLNVDAGGANWDSIPTEYQVRDEDGDVLEGFSKKEDAEKFALENEGSEVIPFTQSSNEVAREAKEMGYDGCVIENVTDEGGEGYGYADESTDYIVFNPSNIKLSDTFTFDDYGRLIPLSKRFDFSNPDIRY